MWSARLTLLSVALGGAYSLVSVSPSQAMTLDYTLSVSEAGKFSDPGPYGTVEVNDTGGKLVVTETLNANFNFRDASDLNHFTLGFNLDKTSTISGITPTGFAQITTGLPANLSPFGSFSYVIDCETSTCVPGGGGGKTLTFTVTDAANDLTLGDIAPVSYTPAGGTAENIYFASDVVDSQGNTGNVGALSGHPPPSNTGSVPEPSTWAMMILGFFGVGFMAYRRKSKSQMSLRIA
jgi:hypothetical protein